MQNKNPQIDIHCHIFTVKQLSRELLVLIMPWLCDLSGTNESLGFDQVRGPEKPRKDILEPLRKFINFFSILGQPSSRDIYEKLKKSYNEDIIIAPLMMDVLYGIKEKKDTADELTTRGFGDDDEYDFEALTYMFEERIEDVYRQYSILSVFPILMGL